MLVYQNRFALPFSTPGGNKMKETHDARERGGRLEQKKKLYIAPRFVEYGSIRKLTHGGSGLVGDAGIMTMLACL